MFENITVAIPAYNEEGRIGLIVNQLKKYFTHILVVDDRSSDNTKQEALTNGAVVVTNRFQKGYIGGIKTGYQEAETEWIANIDADGEHRIEDLVKASEFTLQSDYDLVIGTRPVKQISRPSEIFLSLIAYSKAPVFDTGSGFRIIRKSLAEKMIIPGKCICGTFLLEAVNKKAKIGKHPIHLNSITKPRGIAWYHIPQFFIVMKLLLNIGKKYG